MTLSPSVTIQQPAAPVRIIFEQSIAKTEWWGPRARARLAARWKLGTVKVEPSVKLAATVFDVSVQLVRQEIAVLEIDRLDDDATEPAFDPLDIYLDNCWMGLNEAERIAFVQKHIHALWGVIEKVTA
jgi:hypothetical protein